MLLTVEFYQHLYYSVIDAKMLWHRHVVFAVDYSFDIHHILFYISGTINIGDFGHIGQPCKYSNIVGNHLLVEDIHLTSTKPFLLILYYNLF